MLHGHVQELHCAHGSGVLHASRKDSSSSEGTGRGWGWQDLSGRHAGCCHPGLPSPACLLLLPCHCRFCYVCPAIFVLVNTVTSADCMLLRCHIVTVAILKCFWQTAILVWLQPCFAAHYSTDSTPLHSHSSRIWSPYTTPGLQQLVCCLSRYTRSARTWRTPCKMPGGSSASWSSSWGS